jgi:phosphoenolpyruvate carboxylase
MSSQIMPSDAELKSSRAEEDSAREALALEEDARLRTDLRLLGRILGDTVRDQEGADVFDLVERIRQTSIRFHRDNDRPARRELEIILDSMSTCRDVRSCRAFSYFSHLANIAEDQNNIRQMRAPVGRRRQDAARGVLADTLAHAKAAGHRCRCLAQASFKGPHSSARCLTGASDRGPPQEHHGSRDGGRGPARTAASASR